MRVAYFCSDSEIELFGPKGSSVHICELTNALVDLGHDVFIVCAAVDDSRDTTTSARVYNPKARGLNATAWRHIARDPLVRDNHLARDLSSVVHNSWMQQEGRAIIEQEKPDVLYERYSLFGWAGAELSREFGLPLVLEVNSPLCLELEEYEEFTLQRTASRMEREVFHRASAIIAVSQWLKDWIVEQGVDEDRVHVLPNGFSDQLFRASVSGEGVRRQYGLEGSRVVGFVGSFSHWHGVSGLLQAFGELHESDPALRLLLVGDGDLTDELRDVARARGLASSVVFARNIPHAAIPEFIAAMDVAVAPYPKMDNFYFSPLKLFEYMAGGRPTVAAAIGQVEQVIDHGTTGWLYPPGDSRMMAEGLRTLLYDSERARAMGAAARAKSMECYTWSAVAKKTAEIAEAAANGSKPVRSRGRKVPRPLRPSQLPPRR